MDKVAYSALLDYYGSLLTDYQKEVLRQYYDCDMSLQEISSDLGISRQAISDVIKRASEKLKETDDKLKIIEHTERVRRQLNAFQQRYLQGASAEAKTEFCNIINSVREI